MTKTKTNQAASTSSVPSTSSVNLKWIEMNPGKYYYANVDKLPVQFRTRSLHDGLLRTGAEVGRWEVLQNIVGEWMLIAKDAGAEGQCVMFGESPDECMAEAQRLEEEAAPTLQRDRNSRTFLAPNYITQQTVAGVGDLLGFITGNENDGKYLRDTLQSYPCEQPKKEGDFATYLGEMSRADWSADSVGRLLLSVDKSDWAVKTLAGREPCDSIEYRVEQWQHDPRTFTLTIVSTVTGLDVDRLVIRLKIESDEITPEKWVATISRHRDFMTGPKSKSTCGQFATASFKCGTAAGINTPKISATWDLTADDGDWNKSGESLVEEIVRAYCNLA